MKYAKANKIPIIGVCRGAQALCVFAGGKLVQHVTGHASGNHYVTTTDGEILLTTSCHHQMMYPWDIDYELLAWSSDSKSTMYLGEDNKPLKADGFCEPEVVYFPRVRGLAIQGHPEWMGANDEFVHYCNDLVCKYLLEEKVVA